MRYIRVFSSKLFIMLIGSLLIIDLFTPLFAQIDTNKVSRAELKDRIIIKEDFEDVEEGEIPEGWLTAGKGTFEVVDGKLRGTTEKGESARIVFGDENLRNFSFEADVTFLDTENSGRFIGLMFRANPDGNEPYYQYAKRLNGEYEMAYRTPEAKWDIKKRVSDMPSLEYGDTHHYKVEVYGDIVRYYLDGELLFEEALADDLEKGKLGFQVNRGTMEFDNVKVTTFEAEHLELEGLPSTLEQYERYPYTIMAEMNNGVTIDVTEQANIISNNPSIADFENGDLLIYDEGEVSFTLSHEGTETITQTYEAYKTDKEIVLEKITIEDEAMGIAINEPENIQAIGHYSDFTSREIKEDANWTSEDPTVATVNEGVVTGVQEGETTIEVEKDGKVASIRIRVWEDPDFKDVWFYEDFNDIPDGEIPEGWETHFNGTWEVEDGQLKGTSTTHSPYENLAMITLPYDLETDDYIFEADVSFESVTNQNRYASLMFRVQDDIKSYLHFAGRIGFADNQMELAKRNSNDSWDVRETKPYKKDFDYGDTFRMKMIASGDRFQAFIDDEMVINSDQITDMAGGLLGLQSSGAVIYFDNVKVTLNPDKLPPLEVHEPFTPELPDTGIVLAPVVIGKNLTDPDELTEWSGTGVTSTMVNVDLIDDELIVTNDNSEVINLTDFLSAVDKNLISILQVDNKKAGIKLANYLQSRDIDDIHIVSTNAKVIREIREANPSLRGGIINSLTDLDNNKLRQLEIEAHSSKSNVVILDEEEASIKVVKYLQARGLIVWVNWNSDRKALHTIIHNGVNGIITNHLMNVLEALSIYKEDTISHHQLLVAHRGNTSYTTENTKETIREATRIGSDVLEFDLHRSKDGVLFVYHDGTFKDEHGGGATDSRNYYGDIDQIDLDGKGSRIPTFKEVLEVIKETSDTAVAFPETKKRGLVDQVNEIILEVGMEDRVVLQSFNAGDLLRMQEINPTINTLYLKSGTKASGTLLEAKEEMDFLIYTSSIFGPNYKRIYPTLRDYGSPRGIVFWPWTLKNPEDTAEQMRLGTHAIMTDYVDHISDDPIRLEATQNEVSIEVGESVELTGQKLFRVNEPEEIELDLKVIEGESLVEIEGNKVTAKQEGKVLLHGSTEVVFSEEKFHMYTEPIELTIKGEEEIPKVIELELDQPPVLIFAGALITVKGTNTKIQLPHNLPEGTKLSVHTIEDLLINKGLVQSGEAYEFNLSYPEGIEDYIGEFELSLGINDTNSDISMYMYNEADKHWTKIGGTVQEGRITTIVNNFSKYGVFAQEDKKKGKKQEDITENDDDDRGGSILPKTTTNFFNIMFLGLIIMLIGITFVWLNGRRRTQ